VDATREGDILFKSKEPHTSFFTPEKSTNGRNNAGLPRGGRFLSFENGGFACLLLRYFESWSERRGAQNFSNARFIQGILPKAALTLALPLRWSHIKLPNEVNRRSSPDYLVFDTPRRPTPNLQLIAALILF